VTDWSNVAALLCWRGILVHVAQGPVIRSRFNDQTSLPYLLLDPRALADVQPLEPLNHPAFNRKGKQPCPRSLGGSARPRQGLSYPNTRHTTLDCNTGRQRMSESHR